MVQAQALLSTAWFVSAWCQGAAKHTQKGLHGEHVRFMDAQQGGSGIPWLLTVMPPSHTAAHVCGQEGLGSTADGLLANGSSRGYLGASGFHHQPQPAFHTDPQILVPGLGHAAGERAYTVFRAARSLGRYQEILKTGLPSQPPWCEGAG